MNTYKPIRKSPVSEPSSKTIKKEKTITVKKPDAGPAKMHVQSKTLKRSLPDPEKLHNTSPRMNRRMY